jgi:hypothetical protein
MQLAKRIGVEMGVYDPKAVDENYQRPARASLLGETFSVHDQGVSKAAQWFEQKAQENKRQSTASRTSTARGRPSSRR